MVFYIFALIVTKALPKRMFSLFCPYSNQSPTKKGVFFLLLLPFSNQKGCFFSIFALILIPTKNQSSTKNGVFSIVVLILTKTLPKRVFSFIYYCSNPNQSPAKKGVLFYFCSYPNQSPSTKGEFNIYALTLTKALQCVVLHFCSYSNQNPSKKDVFYIFTKTVFFSIFVLYLTKVSKGAKIRNRYNQVPHLTQDTNRRVTNSQ